ncbi:hypothetical protein ACOMHN_022162 [Nucella lapillus]
MKKRLMNQYVVVVVMVVYSTAAGRKRDEDDKEDDTKQRTASETGGGDNSKQLPLSTLEFCPRRPHSQQRLTIGQASTVPVVLRTKINTTRRSAKREKSWAMKCAPSLARSLPRVSICLTLVSKQRGSKSLK